MSDGRCKEVCINLNRAVIRPDVATHFGGGSTSQFAVSLTPPRREAGASWSW